MTPCYIAGPFRAQNPASHWEVAENVRAAERVHLAACKAGLASVCPHANTALFSGEMPDEFWLEMTLSLLRMVNRSGGVLLVLPGAYESSSGTRAEVAEAERLGMYVFQADPANLLDSLVLTTVGAGTYTSLATVKGATLRLWLERYAEGRR